MSQIGCVYTDGYDTSKCRQVICGSTKHMEIDSTWKMEGYKGDSVEQMDHFEQLNVWMNEYGRNVEAILWFVLETFRCICQNCWDKAECGVWWQIEWIMWCVVCGFTGWIDHFGQFLGLNHVYEWYSTLSIDVDFWNHVTWRNEVINHSNEGFTGLEFNTQQMEHSHIKLNSQTFSLSKPNLMDWKSASWNLDESMKHWSNEAVGAWMEV